MAPANTLNRRGLPEHCMGLLRQTFTIEIARTTVDYLCLDDNRLFMEGQSVFYTDPDLTQENVDVIRRTLC